MNQTLKKVTPFSHTPETTKHLLLVEDERTSCEILLSYLERAGYQVDTATDGVEAWNSLKKNRGYDLIITDRIMPNMDGMELCDRLKQDPSLNHIPVIMQTGAIEPTEIAEGIRAGVFYYLAKPYEEKALLTLVQSALRTHTQYIDFNKRRVQHNDFLDHMHNATFRLRTLNEAQDIAFLLGSTFARPELAVIGLYELLLNAIEHGMLGIGYDLKNTLLQTGTWEKEVQQRLVLPENREKFVTVDFIQTQNQIDTTITDPGTGFAWQNYMEIEPARATQANGRGIAKANLLSFDKLIYHDNGNKVQLFGQRHGQ